jgi:hypothetical protein
MSNTVRTTIKANGNEAGNSYEILNVGDEGYMVRSSSGAESQVMKSQRLVYAVARTAARNGDGAMTEIETIEQKMRANVGSGRGRDPVISASRQVERLEVKEQKLTQALVEIKKSIVSAGEQMRVAAIESKAIEEARKVKQQAKTADAKVKAAARQAKAQVKASIKAVAKEANGEKVATPKAKSGRSSKAKKQASA